MLGEKIDTTHIRLLNMKLEPGNGLFSLPWRLEMGGQLAVQIKSKNKL